MGPEPKSIVSPVVGGNLCLRLTHSKFCSYRDSDSTFYKISTLHLKLSPHSGSIALRICVELKVRLKFTSLSRRLSENYYLYRFISLVQTRSAQNREISA